MLRWSFLPLTSEVSTLISQPRRECFGFQPFAYRTTIPMWKKKKIWYDSSQLCSLLTAFPCLLELCKGGSKPQHVFRLCQSEGLHPDLVQSPSNRELALHVWAMLAGSASAPLPTASITACLAQPCQHLLTTAQKGCAHSYRSCRRGSTARCLDDELRSGEP